MPVLLVIVIFCSQINFQALPVYHCPAPNDPYGQQINEYVLPGENCVFLLVFALVRWYHLKRTVSASFCTTSDGITWREQCVSASLCTGPVASPHLLGGITWRELGVSASFCTGQVVSPEENCFCQFLHQVRWYYLKRTVCFCQFLHQVRWYHLKRTGCFCQFLHWSGGLRSGQTPSLIFQQPWRKDAKTEAWSVSWCLYVQGIICCSAILL